MPATDDRQQLELESLGLVYPRDARPKRAKPQREIPFPDALYLPVEGEDEFSDGACASRAFCHGNDAAQLLRCITDLLTTVESKHSRRQRRIKYGYAIAAAYLAGILLGLTVYAFNQLTAPDSRLLTTVDVRPAFHPEPGAVRSSNSSPPDRRQGPAAECAR